MLTDLPDKRDAATRRPTLWRAIFLATLLITFDAIILGQGGVALFVGIWVLLIALPLTFLKEKYATVRSQRLRNMTIYIGAVLLVFAINAANNRLAQSRTESLVTAVKAFHTRHGTYPNSLEELVPEFVDRIPVAKYTLGQNQFWYQTSDRYTAISYVRVAPFGRSVYSFAEDKWGFRD